MAYFKYSGATAGSGGGVMGGVNIGGAPGEVFSSRVGSNLEFRTIDGISATVATVGDVINITPDVFNVFGRTGNVTAQLNDYVGSLVGNDSGVAGATISDALNTLNNKLQFQGTWNASTNTPTLGNGGAGGNQGDYYVVSVAGNTSLDGISDWEVGDWVVNNGSTWDKVDNTELVTSVFGRQGAVVAQANDYTWAQIDKTSSSLADIATKAINQLDDVTITSVANGELLVYSAGIWINQTLAEAGIEPTVTKGDLTESTSSVLTITGGTGSVIGTGTTIEVGQADAANDGYLSSSDWSTFNDKQEDVITTRGDVIRGSSGGAAERLALGTNGQALTSDGNDAVWANPTDANAIHDDVAGEINAITEKVTPVSADLIIIEDSADSNNKKKIQIGNLTSGLPSSTKDEYGVVKAQSGQEVVLQGSIIAGTSGSANSDFTMNYTLIDKMVSFSAFVQITKSGTTADIHVPMPFRTSNFSNLYDGIGNVSGADTARAAGGDCFANTGTNQLTIRVAGSTGTGVASTYITGHYFID